ncbi:MAG: hypothetical protein KA366_06015 [Hydromonas sp.]|nr:hypothetical protein [Hydromonas sp.]
MLVHISHNVEASEQDAEGFYDYYYEYDILVFSEGEVSLVARSYIDKPDEVHFLRLEAIGEHRLLTERDMKSTLLIESVAYLRRNGKTEINWLSGRGNGYQPVPGGAP